VIFLGSNKMSENQAKPAEVVDTLRSEHLNEGVRPIMACIGTREQFLGHPGAEKAAFSYTELTPDGTTNVDFGANPTDLKEKAFKNAGWHSYVISTIDDSNKLSKGFYNCTGVVVTGIDKMTGENISFVSHQYPGVFLDENGGKNVFVNDLKSRIQELKSRVVDGTIDAVVIGGNYLFHNEEDKERYRKSIQLLAKEFSDVLGFEPVAMTGPKTDFGKDDIFYDNKNRRLYIMRPDVGRGATKSYMPNQLAEQEKKWNK
jgi:hypothetical protein